MPSRPTPNSVGHFSAKVYGGAAHGWPKKSI